MQWQLLGVNVLLGSMCEAIHSVCELVCGCKPLCLSMLTGMWVQTNIQYLSMLTVMWVQITYYFLSGAL